MINLEIPKKFEQLVNQSHQVATEIFRTNSRKYDRAEHEYPKELDMLAAVIDGMNESGALSAQPARERHLAGEAEALVHPAGRTVGRKAHPV